MNYNGEKFLDLIYKDLYKSDEVRHTTQKNDSKEESIRRYLERIEKIHNEANNEYKKNLIKELYYKKYVIKKENLPYHLTDNEKENIIECQKKSLGYWIDYLSDNNARYPMWAKYYIFQQMLKLGNYDEISGKYTKRDKKTINPFIEVNPEIIAKCVENIIKILDNQQLSTQKIRLLTSNISFEKMYIQYKNEQKIRYKSNEGIWIKYRKNNIEDAKKLSASLNGYNTEWCTANETTAIKQVCGEKGFYPGGDFYVFYTKNEQGNYIIPRIAIRMENNNIGEIRGVSDYQNLENDMIPILETKLNEMKNLSNYDVKKNLNIINDLKYLISIKEKTQKNIQLSSKEIVDLYTKKFGFGFENDPLVNKIIKNRNFEQDYLLLENMNYHEKAIFILNCKNAIVIQNSKFRITEEGVILELRRYGLGEKYSLLSDEWLNNKEYILNVLSYDSDIIPYISDRLKDDKDLFLEVVKQRGILLKYASEKLKNDKEIVLEAVKNNGLALEYASESLKMDKEVVLEAVKNKGLALEYASESLKMDKEIVLEAVKNYGLALKYASESLKMDKEVVLEAVKNKGFALKYASESLKMDKEVVLEAVKNKGLVLQYASESLKNDKEVVLEAVKKCGPALEYASETLKNDEMIALTAVTDNPVALNFISKRQKFNVKIILAALKKDFSAIEYFSESIKKYIMTLLSKKNSEKVSKEK